MAFFAVISIVTFREFSVSVTHCWLSSVVLSKECDLLGTKFVYVLFRCSHIFSSSQSDREAAARMLAASAGHHYKWKSPLPSKTLTVTIIKKWNCIVFTTFLVSGANKTNRCFRDIYFCPWQKVFVFFITHRLISKMWKTCTREQLYNNPWTYHTHNRNV